ncbi:MAG: tetratricopeptide repeat protein [Vicinamibacterales bacterium]
MKALDSVRWRLASAHLDDLLDAAPADRTARLDALRAGDPTLAAEVQALLDEHRRLIAEGFLEGGFELPAGAAGSGLRVGAYTLVSRIGQGGMGTVWLATRSDGRFEGEVAVKLLNASLIGGGGEARFRREGTLLARLTHPNIARLTDAGVSPTGQPYLVLERVDGRHIDDYCDEARLPIDARIRMALDICAAVAHAHANLVVHRDIKPSNVLVTREGHVKLLDFGIAKLLEDDGAHASPTLVTSDGTALTPKYAAPEQVSGGPISTATDVYALGVLLFELLSGRHPARAEGSTPADFARALVHGEPLRLSAALDGRDAEALRELAARRGTTPERLARALRGDLETILARALKRDPLERYASVEALADDLRRCLALEPIAARPDTMAYRAGKFARRHWRGLAAAAAVLTLIVGLVAFYTVQLAAERDRAQLEAAKSARTSELLTDLLTGADPFRTPDGTEPTVSNLLDRGADRISTELADQPELQAEMLALIGRTFERMGQMQKAQPVLERALAISRAALGPDDVRVAQSLNNLGVLYRGQGDLARAEPLLEEALAMRRRLLGPVDKDVAVTLVELARVVDDRGDLDGARALQQEALAIRQQVFGDEHRETATSKNDLGLLLWEHGDLVEADRLLSESAATNERLLGPDHPNTGSSWANLGLVKIARGDGPAAEALLRKALRVSELVFGPSRMDYAITLNGLAGAVEIQGRLDESRRLLEEAMRIGEASGGADHAFVVTFSVNLSRVRLAQGEGSSVEPVLLHALEVRRRIYPEGHWRIAQVQGLLGGALLAQGRLAEAEPLLLAANAGLPPTGRQASEYAANRARLAELYARTNRPALAATYR